MKKLEKSPEQREKLLKAIFFGWLVVYIPFLLATFVWKDSWRELLVPVILFPLVFIFYKNWQTAKLEAKSVEASDG